MAYDYKELKAHGFMQQKQPGCFSMRLKSVGGKFTAAQLQTVQAVAEKFGEGYVHLTSRQGIEIPFIKEQDIEDVKKALAAGGLATGFCGAQVRTITACQGNAVCRSGLIDTARLAEEFAERYAGKMLPHKFKVGFTGCHNNCLKTEENDIGIKGGVKPVWQKDKCKLCGACVKICPRGALTLDREKGKILWDRKKCYFCGKCTKGCKFEAFEKKTGFVVSFGGLYGNRIAIGKKIVPLIYGEDKLRKALDAALDYFEQHANKGERFRNMLDRIGWEEFTQIIRESQK
ncbi:4Fe-4S binding protein [Selenomonas ruminantium]|uniref:Dissimilatory sulfite reductase (Desulfoviridin), alpha and beta subunits n=1 Tax=Selenomonas ruminantium TaxID=971 RepID=A0A1H3W5P6_SELRU|nr:4Fe-4S binding protein [Selenomonas ruminantium]SDZ82415.1 Dissimilatory sulfite reductase (desulfoviridin), alpha and beta subunits [Selenomonas ruminantium]